MKHREKLIARWTNCVPGLDGPWDHWWLEGDGGLILVTSDISELLRAIEENYGKSLRLNVSRARRSPEGDSIREKADHIVSDFVEDGIYGWQDGYRNI